MTYAALSEAQQGENLQHPELVFPLVHPWVKGASKNAVQRVTGYFVVSHVLA
jgi:hypothetical protein